MYSAVRRAEASKFIAKAYEAADDDGFRLGSLSATCAESAACSDGGPQPSEAQQSLPLVATVGHSLPQHIGILIVSTAPLIRKSQGLSAGRVGRLRNKSPRVLHLIREHGSAGMAGSGSKILLQHIYTLPDGGYPLSNTASPARRLSCSPRSLRIC